jgi:hypothetical protein
VALPFVPVQSGCSVTWTEYGTQEPDLAAYDFCPVCQELPGFCRCRRRPPQQPPPPAQPAADHPQAPPDDEEYLAEATVPVGAGGRPHQRDESAGDGPDSWAPIDLRPYLRGEIVRPEPSLGMARTDGLRLLYPGKEHAVIGEMEAGKSWFALASVAAELNAENHVVYAHFEECDPSDSVDRLVALGVRDSDILRFLRFVGPERSVSRDALAALLAPPFPTLVIFDGVNEAMALHRWAIREEDGAAEYRRRLVKPCTRVGAAVLSLDHVVKDAERRARTALGSVHKVNGLSGALILVENAEPFGRGQRGRSHVHIMKDRPGFLRRHGRPDPKTPGKTFMGELVVDDTRRFVPFLEVTFHAPKSDGAVVDSATTGDAALANKVFAALEALIDGKGMDSERAVFAQCRKAGISASNTHIRVAVDDLIAHARLIEVVGKRGAKGYRISTEGAHVTGE